MEGRKPPECGECGVTLVRGRQVLYCLNCDYDEAGALGAADDAHEREEVRYDPVLGDRCHECDECGDYQCSVHGDAVLLAMRTLDDARPLCEKTGREILAILVCLSRKGSVP